MSGLLVIPSIDILNGRTVRVVRGIAELGGGDYNSDPVEMALIWRAENAKIIHVVDFDFSHEHSTKNLDVVRQICSSVIIPVEFGGGIRSLADAEMVFEAGVFRIVIGSLGYDNPEELEKIVAKFGNTKVVAAIDSLEEKVVIHGRKIKTNLSVFDYAKRLVNLGINRIIITDVSRNGTMKGPNIDLTVKLASTVNAKITHSGGIGGYKDLKNFIGLEKLGVDSVIIGRALYENKFPCQKIWRIAEFGLFN